MTPGVLHTMQALATSLSSRRLEPQQILFEAGEPGESIFCVLSGEVELRWGDGPGELFRPGDVLGVGALVSDAHRRHGTARALLASELIEMSREQFLFAVQETPMFALELMAGLERRLRRLEE
jgi:CRP/FNR family cyclic AMP-dependent transcriptional regulator